MSYYNAPRPRSHTVLDSNGISLEVRQQPVQALVTNEHKEKIRKAVDPPPIVQLKVHDSQQANHVYWLVNPFLFMNVQLVDPDPVNGAYKQVPGSSLLGTTVSSLHRLKDVANRDGGFFVFGDISCRRTGRYRLQFNLFDFEKQHQQAVYIASTVSDPFHVVTTKEFRGQGESTPLSRTFSDQGVRLRLRKEQRAISGSKRGYGSPSRDSSTPSMSLSGPAPKRQRSDGDYTPQMYQTPQAYPTPHQAHNTLLPYGGNFAGGSHRLAVQPQQNILTSQAGTYDGLMSQSHPRSTSTSNWQRDVKQEHLTTPIGASGNHSYLSSLDTMTPGQRNQRFAGHPQQQSPQHHLRAPEYVNNSLSGYDVSNPLSDNTLGSHELQNYMRPSPSLQGHHPGFNIGPTSYVVANQDSSAMMQSQYGFRMGLSNPSMSNYETRMRPGANDTSQGDHLQLRPTAGQYDSGHFASGDGAISETPRETLSASTADLSDGSFALDSGVLNRGFMPPYPIHQHSSPGHSGAHYKEPPYPTPH